MSEDVTREVDRLLKDRARYQDWLKRLEDQKQRASEQAYGRVRADYRKRLDDVLSRLKEHGEALRGRLQQVERHAEELRGQRGERSDRLDEARLRRSVGEYTDEREWSELENRLSAALDEADRQLAETRSEIERLNEILAAVAEAPAPQPARAEPAESARPAAEMGVVKPPPETRPREAEARPEPEPAEPRVEPAAPERPEAAEPWEVPLRAERPAGEPAEEGEAPPGRAVEETFPPGVKRVGEAPEPEAAEGDEGFLSLEELILDDEELAGSEIQEEKPAEPEAEPSAEEETPTPGVGDELAFLESLSLSGGEEKESFSFLEQHGSGSARTIVCPHCSAANDPAEWYCTECGEELPAE